MRLRNPLEYPVTVEIAQKNMPMQKDHVQMQPGGTVDLPDGWAMTQESRNLNRRILEEPSIARRVPPQQVNSNVVYKAAEVEKKEEVTTVTKKDPVPVPVVKASPEAVPKDVQIAPEASSVEKVNPKKSNVTK